MENRIVLKGFPHDSLWVQAIMYFPADKFLRDSWFTAQLVQGELLGVPKGCRKVECNKETITQLVNAPSLEELEKKKTESFKKGVLAGCTLASIYLMDHFNIDEPSINKAVHISEKFAAENQYGDSTRINKSRKSIREAFKEYKSVAHLWAALYLNKTYPYADDRELFFEKLTFFLEISAGLLEFGTTFKPYRARPKEPILPNESMWQLPKRILPHHLESNIFPDGITHFLKDYDSNEYQ